MELTDLRYFLHVAEARSFSKGAARAHVSPPAMSKAVAKLEAELGTRLLVRTTRHVALTSAGELLRARCRRIFDEVDGLRREIEETDAVVKGEVRIGAMEVFSIRLLPIALARLVGRHPLVVPYTHEMHPRRMVELLGEGALDVGFTIGAPPTRGVDVHPIGRSRGVLVCGAGHPLFHAGRVRASELHRHPFVAPRTLGLEHLPPLDQFPDSHSPRTIGATIELLQMGLELVAEGAYLGFFPDICVREHLAADRLRIVRGLPTPVTFDLVAMTRSSVKPKRSVQLLIEETTAVVAWWQRSQRRAHARTRATPVDLVEQHESSTPRERRRRT